MKTIEIIDMEITALRRSIKSREAKKRQIKAATNKIAKITVLRKYLTDSNPTLECLNAPLTIVTRELAAAEKYRYSGITVMRKQVSNLKYLLS